MELCEYRCLLRPKDFPADRRQKNAHALAYDSKRGRVVLFGGADAAEVLGDTWEWDGSRCTQISTTGPGPRTFATMAYDSARRRVVLFGGNRVLFGKTLADNIYLDDTWEWDGQTWLQIKVSGPPPRAEAAMVFDSRRGRVVLFGGHNRASGERNWLGDTWEWNGKTWTQVSTIGPAPRNGAAMVFDNDRGRTVLFGGSAGGVACGETWEWDGKQWVENRLAATEGRFNSVMAYDEGRHRVIRFGGNFAGTRTGDTWEYNGKLWKQLSSIGPAARNHSAMVYDVRRKKMILLAGMTE
jgi:hypothetical protein